MTANDAFLTLLHQRRKRRAALLSSTLFQPKASDLFPVTDLVSSPLSPSFPSPSHSEDRSFHVANNVPANLSTHYLFSSSRPQNEIQNPYPNCFEGYPKLQRSSPLPFPSFNSRQLNFPRLTDLKKQLVFHRSHPPTGLKIDWRNENLLARLTRGLPSPVQPSAQGLRFDVIVISEEGGREHFSEVTQLASLPIESLAATPSFLFLWLPSSDLLEVGRALLQRWGFRRAEDIVWVKTNHAEIDAWKNGGPMPVRRRRNEDSPDAVFVRTKEHCLMGIRGTVRRSVLCKWSIHTDCYQVDSHFIHCNVDTDVIIAEEASDGTKRKPDELFNIIENFCMGRRRLEIFGSDETMRPGWLTVGDKVTISTFEPKDYLSYFHDGNLVGHHQGSFPFKHSPHRQKSKICDQNLLSQKGPISISRYP